MSHALQRRARRELAPRLRVGSGAGRPPAPDEENRPVPQPKKAARSSARKTAPPPAAAAPDPQAAMLVALRERLVSSVTLTTERLQDAVDDAVRRGRMTRKDAEELLTTLVAAGRTQTEALLADVEQLLGRGAVLRARPSRQQAGDAVLRTVDRARRRVGVGSTFPILGYDDLTAVQVTKRLGGLTPAELRKVRDYERRNARRKSVLAAIERKLG
jgi:polyhydroxyalkanoate synthesis regulator phasin